MANKPRWLSTVAAGMIVALVLLACTPAAGPTTAPATQAPPATTAPVTAAPVTAAPATDAPATDAPATDAPATDAPVTEPPATAYPAMGEQPSDPATIADAYPNYGGDVDCDAGTFNGLPYAGTVKKISAPDPLTVVFDLCAPDVAFLSKMAFSVFAVNDSEYLIEHAAAGDLKDEMNGTGPLVLDRWQRGTELDFSRFDGYWGDPAATATAVLNWLDPATKLTELTNGTIDGYTLVSATEYDTISGNPDQLLVPGGGLNTLYLGFNHNYEPWDNLAVRQALAIGIDRQRIVDTFMPPGSEVATHFTPCSIAFGCEGDEWPATNVATARQMITDAVGEAGITTTLAWRNPPIRGYLPQPDETATDFQAQLEAINIHVTLDKQESGTFIANSNTGDLTGLFLLGWGADYPDVTNFLDYHFGEGCTSAFGDCFPEIYEPLKVGAQTAVEADRAAAYVEANNAIAAVVPMVPISHAGFANAYKAGVEVAQASPLSNELLFRMAPPGGGDTIVFAQNAEPIGLYCADETDGESLRACEQSMEGLYGFVINGVDPEPLLATSCEPNEDLSQWTCHLREGVAYHNAATFEAKDVIASFAAQWDAASVLHVGNTGVFEYWGGLWGGNLNPPAPCGIPDQPACEE